jgi:predicted nucleic acid-binding protein
VSTELLLDNSAWARLNDPSLSPQRIEEIATALERREIAVCLPFLLEAAYSARNATEHRDLLDELLALPLLQIDAQIERRAVHAQRQLARVGHHRLPPVDLIMAVIAERHHIGVLHYDGDYDILADKTDVNFASVWLAPRGSI